MADQDGDLLDPMVPAAFAPFALHADAAGDPRAQLLFSAQHEFRAGTPVVPNNFTRGVRVSPDGLCVLSNSEDHVLRLFEPSGALSDLDAVRHACPVWRAGCKEQLNLILDLIIVMNGWHHARVCV